MTQGIKEELLIKQKYKSEIDSQYKIKTLKSIEEVEETRDVWESMELFPLAIIDNFLSELNLQEDIVKPHVILLSKDDSPEAIIVGRIENTGLIYRIGYKELVKINVRSLRIGEGCIGGNTTYDNSKLLFFELLKSIKLREVDIISIKDIPADSYIYQLATTVPSFFHRDHFPAINEHFVMTMPASIDEFYGSKKRKNNLLSIGKRLNKDFSNNVVVKEFYEKEDLVKFCKDAEQISKKTYQYALGDGFVNNKQTNLFLTLLADRGQLRAHILYLNDTPSAFQWAFIHKNTLYGRYTGYDPTYRKYGIGNYLFLKVIEDLCNDNQVQYFDFGGVAGMNRFLKQRFCDISSKWASLYIFQPTIKGILLNALKSLSSISHHIFYSLLTYFKLEGKWYKFLHQRNTPS